MFDFTKTYYIYDDTYSWGFVKLLYETGDRIQFFRCSSFKGVQKLHPKYGNGKSLESYSDEMREFHKWLEFETIRLCNAEKDYLKEHLIVLEGNLDDFPFANSSCHLWKTD